MARVEVTVSDEVMVLFDAAAAALGGRSARIRQLITQAAESAGPQTQTAARTIRTRATSVLLDAFDTARLDAEAAALQIPRSAWVAALVRRRVRHAPTFSRAEAPSLIEIYTELRRLSVSLNQILRAENTGAEQGQNARLDANALDDLRREIRVHMRALKKAFEGNLAYWEIAE